MPATKIATCCYCGTKASLVLAGKVRHELACATCGAPLRRLKMLRKEPQQVAAPVASPSQPMRPKRAEKRSKKRVNRPLKRFNISRLGRKLFEEIWDEIEDIFD